VSALIVAITWHLDLRLGVEDVTADSFCNGHAKVDEKTDSRDANSSIILVGTCQEGCVVVMVVAMV
jgi:hypothetical protein